MSKASQRKQSFNDEKIKMQQQGFKDALGFEGYRWTTHPLINLYDKGYKDGLAYLTEGISNE